MKILLAHGADPNVQDFDLYTPLHLAVKNEDVEMVSTLLDRDVKVEMTNINDETPLHLAAQNVSGEIARLLLNAGTSPWRVRRDGTNYLHSAIQYGNVGMVSILLEKGVYVNVSDDNGEAPLHIAARYGSNKIVQLLLNAGASASFKRNDGKTPLHLAVDNENEEVVSVLLNRGANIESSDENGDTPLHAAARSESDKIIRLLLNAGAKSSALSCAGWSPLHYATDGRHGATTSMLLKYGSDVNVKKTAGGDTPMHSVAQVGRWDIAYELLEYGASLDATNSDFETPLHEAVKYAPSEFLRNLLEYITRKCDLNILNMQRGHDGFTALRIAIDYGLRHRVEALLENGANFKLCSASGESDLDAALKSKNEHIRKLGQDFKQLMAMDGHPSLSGLQGHAPGPWG